MKYRVIYTRSFLEDVGAHVDYLLSRRVSGQTIENWYTRLFDRLDGLDTLPKRMPVDARQSQIAQRETRKFNFGDYLVFYHVDEPARTVHVTALMHGTRRHETE